MPTGPRCCLTEDDLLMRRRHGTLAAVVDRGPTDCVELLLSPGDARRVEALAHVAEVIHGAPCRFSDLA